MKAETPAEGISLTSKFKDSKFYKVNCSCGNEDDEINFEVEVDHDGVIMVHTWTTQKTPWWNEVVKKRYDIDNEFLQGVHWLLVNFANGVLTRLKLTWQIWVKGYAKYESWTVMSKQQALNYSETLKTAIKDLESTKTS